MTAATSLMLVALGLIVLWLVWRVSVIDRAIGRVGEELREGS